MDQSITFDKGAVALGDSYRFEGTTQSGKPLTASDFKTPFNVIVYSEPGSIPTDNRTAVVLGGDGAKSTSGTSIIPPNSVSVSSGGNLKETWDQVSFAVQKPISFQLVLLEQKNILPSGLKVIRRPLNPTDLTSIDTGTTTSFLSWTSPDNNLAVIVVHTVGKIPENCSDGIVSVLISGANYELSNLVANTEYGVKVCSVDLKTLVSSDDGAEYTFTFSGIIAPEILAAENPTATATATATQTVPAPPTGLVVTPGTDQNTLTWADSPGAISYNIYWKINAGVTTADTKITAATSPYTHHSLYFAAFVFKIDR